MDGTRKDAKYCGNVCRQSAYQKRTYEPKPKPKATVKPDRNRDCLNCFATLDGKQRMFCSDACRKQYHRDEV